MSLDHVVHLLMGLGLVKKFAPGQTVAIYDDQGKAVGSINFTNEINDYLYRLKSSLERDWYLPKLTGSNLFPATEGWASGILNAASISIAIDRIINNNYGNTFNCHNSSAQGIRCADMLYDVPYQVISAFLDQYALNLGLVLVPLAAMLLMPGLAFTAWLSSVLMDLAQRSVHNVFQGYDHAILGGSLALSAPYFAGIRLSTEWRDWLLTNFCNWFGGSCDNLRLRFLCIRTSRCIAVDSNNDCVLSFSAPILQELASTIGALIGFVTGVNPGSEFCIPYPHIWGFPPPINADWSVNITSGLVREHFDQMVTRKNLVDDNATMSMARFYPMLEYVMFNKSREHRTDLTDHENDYYNYLATMPCSGPQHLPDYSFLPRNERKNPNHNVGWRTDNSFVKVYNSRRGTTNVQGKFNGLDYMLFHNLYRIAFPDRPNPPYANKMISNATLDQLKVGDNAFFEEYQPTASGAGVGTATRRVYADKSIQLMGAENVTGGQTGYSYMIKPVDAPGTNNPSALLFKPLVPTCDNSSLYKLDAPYNNARQAAPVDTTPKPDYTQEQIDSVGRKMLSDIRSRVKRIRPIPKYQPVSAFVASAPSVPMSTQEQLSLYPNPATTMLNLQLLGLGEVALTYVAVTSATGSTIVLPFTQGNNGAYTCPVSDLTPGLYIINVVTKRGNYVRKFTKQ